MKYVSNVIGQLNLKDLNITMNNMEIVDFSSEDFKSSLELREALRKAMLVPYNALVHRHAYELKKQQQQPPPPPAQQTIVQVDATETKAYIKSLESKFDLLLNKMNTILATKEQVREIHIIDNNNKTTTNVTAGTKTKAIDDAPIYIPSIDTTNISTKQIITQEEQAEGTDNILEQLKKLKK